MATTTTMTGAAFDQLPYEEGRNLELLQGELIVVPSPTPEHQMIVGGLYVSFVECFRREPGGGALLDSEFVLGRDDRLRSDVAVLLGERWVCLDLKKTPITVAPDIAVEVISPSERTAESDRKVSTYLAVGTQEVWQFYPESQKVFVYRGPKSVTPLYIDDSLSTPLLPGWELPLREIFTTKPKL
ncbi:MAG TPA: Uma2 family endonuclease [Bryobacteraceae bacterium]|nr:Uma2 family endonuclease [Bryobacteraceae bacterium]